MIMIEAFLSTQIFHRVFFLVTVLIFLLPVLLDRLEGLLSVYGRDSIVLYSKTSIS